jgi:hydroxymethylbilane synthase
MLPAPAQGAIVVVSRGDDKYAQSACAEFNDADTALCTQIERDFLRSLMGGCSTPIAGLCEVRDGVAWFRGNIMSPDGTKICNVEKSSRAASAHQLGYLAGEEIRAKGGQAILDAMSAGLKDQ